MQTYQSQTSCSINESHSIKQLSYRIEYQVLTVDKLWPFTAPRNIGIFLFQNCVIGLFGATPESAWGSLACRGEDTTVGIIIRWTPPTGRGRDTAFIKSFNGRRGGPSRGLQQATSKACHPMAFYALGEDEGVLLSLKIIFKSPLSLGRKRHRNKSRLHNG